jgi:hypothetical protein
LEKAGLIARSRANIRIVDRQKLEKAACECYGIMQTRVQAWLGDSQK